MNVVFIGDITGPRAVADVAARLPALRRAHAVDLVVANADNVAVTGPDPAAGFGMTVEAVETLLAAGVDVVTSGSHGRDGPEAARALAHPRVLRPYNLPATVPGRGLLTVAVAGEPVSVLTLADTPTVPDAAPAYPSWRAAPTVGTTLVHFVGDVFAARVFAAAIDGQAAAVLGTLGHEASLHLYRLPGGTGFVPDVGMVGALGPAGAGIDPLAHFAARLRGADAAALPPFHLAEGPWVFEAVWLRVVGGRTEELARLSVL